jgi:hypothetical protein
MKKGGCRAAIVARMVGSIVVTFASIAGLNTRPAIAARYDVPASSCAITRQSFEQTVVVTTYGPAERASKSLVAGIAWH